MLYFLLTNIHHRKVITENGTSLNTEKWKISLSFESKSSQATYPSDLVHWFLYTTVEGVKVKLIKQFNKRENYEISENLKFHVAESSKPSDVQTAVENIMVQKYKFWRS